ncbi:MAG: CGNR zinc finger domain-containing protein [Fimbriimonadales bacterium]
MVAILFESLGIAEGDEPLCLQFTNTVAERRSATPDDAFVVPEALGAWLVERSLASEDFEIDEPYRIRAIQLRDSIYRLLSGVAARNPPDEENLEALNGELCEALAKIDLDSKLRWSLTEQDPGERALMLIALSAAELLTSPLRDRVRECASETCGWLFIDHSKNRSRRWCSMSDCGNLEKAKRFQERKRMDSQRPHNSAEPG